MLAMQTPVRSNVILTSTGHMHHAAGEESRCPASVSVPCSAAGTPVP
jgi:hypothetical protein